MLIVVVFRWVVLRLCLIYHFFLAVSPWLERQSVALLEWFMKLKDKIT